MTSPASASGGSGGERELVWLNRALRMLSDSNQALIRITDEAALLREVCRIVVDVGGYRMAWVGFPEQDERKSVRVAAVAGFEQGYIEAMRITWADGPGGRGPVGTAMRTGELRIIHDIRTDPTTVPWREVARERGYESVAAVPLLNEGRNLGSLNIYSAEAAAFDTEEVKILLEMAGDLAFGLGALRRRVEHDRAEERLHKSEQEFRAFVENSPDLIMRFDHEYRLTYVNPAMARMFRLPAEAFLNQPIGATTARDGQETNPEGLAQARAAIAAVFASGEPHEVEVRWPTPGGEIALGVRYFPEQDRSGAVASVLAIGRDITERRRAEAALQSVLRHARTTVMQSLVTAPEGWDQHEWEWSATHYRWESHFDDEAAAQEVMPLALAPGERYYAGWVRAKHRDDLWPMNVTAARAFVAGAPSWRQEFRAIDRHGRLHWFAQVAAIKPAGRGRWHVTTINTDVTELKQAEDERRTHLWLFENLDRINRAIQGAVSADQMMSDVLGALLEIFDCDRAWLVYPADPEAASWHVPMERTRPEYPGGLALRVEMPMDPTTEAVMRVLRAEDGPVKFGPGETHVVPPPVAEKFGVQSFIAMALHPKGEKPYVFGLHQCSRPRTWTLEEQKLFSEVGRRMTDALTSLRAQQRHQESEHRQRLALQTGRIGTFETNLATDHGTWSPELAEIWGLTGESAGEFPAFAWQQVHPEDVERVRAEFSQTVAQRENREMEFRIVRPDGVTRWLRWRGQVLADAGTQALRVIGVNMDITEQKQAQAALEAREREFRALTENSPDLIARFDRSHRAVFVNRAVEKIYGLPAAEVVGRRFEEIAGPDGFGFDPEAARVVRQLIEEVFATGRPAETHVRPRLPDRELIMNLRIVPETDETGLVMSVLSIGRDVTAQRRAEEAARESQARLELANRATRVGPWDWDLETNEVQFSAEWKRQLGYEPHEIAGRYDEWESRLHPDDRERVLGFVQAYLAGTRPDYEVEFRMRHKDGSYRWIFTRGEILRAPDGKPRRLIGCHLDITERKRAEEALRDSQHAHAALVNTIDGIVWELDVPTFRFTFVSQQAERLLGYPVTDWLDQPTFWTDHLHPGDRGWAVDYCFKATAEKRDHDFYYRMLAADGRVVWLHDIVTVVVEHGQPAKLRGIMVDVTETKAAEEGLRWRTALFEAQANSALDGILVVDGSGRKILQNERMNELWKIPRAIVENPDDGEQLRYVTGQTKNAAKFAEKVAFLYAHPEEISRDEVELTDGTVLDRYTAPVRDRSGQHYGRIWTFRDITATKQLEEQLRQSQKMEAVGQLAGGIAHDFNNLLTVVQMQASLLLADRRLDPETRLSVRQIMDAATRAANLTRQLLTFSRQNVKQARALDLGEVVTSTTKLLRRVLGEHIALESHFASNLPLVQADPGMMEQVLMNLVINARDAMPGGGRLVISLDTADFDADYAAAHPPAKRGRFVRLRVSDSGSGIAPENLRRIFEPFFTTKEVGKGTGLGLATVFGIVQQHHGWIEVESEPGKGSTFCVFLPPLTTVAPVEAAPVAPVLRGGTETLLIVEDEALVRAVAVAALKRRGYRVIEAETAADAVRRWDAQQGKIDLLLTDLIMPGGVSGRQLAEELRGRRPGLKIVFTSGYGGEALSRELTVTTGDNFLPKPYSLDELVAIVRRKLDEV
jgi:two-component system cell cycle sensor histidine kinase/response regulator CckA